MLAKPKIQKFQKEIYRYYKAHRRNFAWRPPSLKLRKGKADPYHVLVSEVMLQQTQTSRVEKKYPLFVKQFPSVQTLAGASPSAVLGAWSGLGYNRRATFLKRAAEIICEHFDGKVPASYEALRQLPGVGHNTAGAVLAFAFNIAVPFIETNVRSVFIHHFFSKKKRVSDKIILPYVRLTLDPGNARDWYYALMDYGAMLKEKYSNPSRKSAHHQKQSRFEGSHRQLRGMILKTLLVKPRTQKQLESVVSKNASEIKTTLTELTREKFIEKYQHIWRVCA